MGTGVAGPSCGVGRFCLGCSVVRVGSVVVGAGKVWLFYIFLNVGNDYISCSSYSVHYRMKYLPLCTIRNFPLSFPPLQISIIGHPTTPPVRCLPSVPQGQCHLSVPAPGARRVRQIQGGHRHDAHQHHAEGGEGHHVPGQPDLDGHSADR